ncbi:MAG: carbon starvation CstA family protein [Candidatus Heimdallarchaeota archaeon]
MTNLVLYILGASLLLWLFLAQQLLTRLNTHYFLSENEITTAYSKYDRYRHRPTNWIVLAFFHFFSVFSLSFFVSMMISVMYGLVISAIYVFLGTLFISFPLNFFGLHLGAIEKTESPLRLLSQKKSTQAVLLVYLILFATFSIITFSLLLVNFLPYEKEIIFVMGFSIFFLFFEGWTRFSESSFSLLGVILLIGALMCGIFFQQNILGDRFAEYLVLASVLLMVLAYTKLSSSTQRISFLLLASTTIAFFLILANQAITVHPINKLNELTKLLDRQNLNEIFVFANLDDRVFLFLPVIMIPSVSSGFLAILSWQSTAKQIRFDSDIPHVSYLSTFLLVTAQYLVLAFAFSVRNSIPIGGSFSLLDDFLPAIFHTEYETLIYIAITYMTFLIIVPTFQLADASINSLSPNRVLKGIFYLFIGGGVFLVSSQYENKDIFLFFVLFGSASVGVTAIYMSLARSYFKSEGWGIQLLTLIALLLFISSIAGFLLVGFNMVPSEFPHALNMQFVTSRFLLFLLAIIASILEFILIIRILTRK